MGGFSAVLRRYGRPAVLADGEFRQIGAAMVFPMFDKGEQWLPTPLGTAREDRFLFLGAPELEIDRLGCDGYVEWEGQRYRVVTAQGVALGGKMLYRWAVLLPRDPEEMDGEDDGDERAG